MRRLIPLLALALSSLLLLAACATPTAPASAGRTVTISDQWGRQVTVPRDPQRVVVIEWEGLVSKSMQVLGVADRIVAVDRSTKKQTFRNVVVPAIGKADEVGTAFSGLNFERIAGLAPDVVILEAWANNDKNRGLHNDIVAKLEALQVPTIVMLSPSNHERPELAKAWEFITMVGTLFGQEAKAATIVDRLEREVADIRTRIAPLAGTAPSVAIFATLANVMGPQSVQSTMLTDVLGAKNPVPEGTFVQVSEEKLLALDPQVLLVIGHEGWVDPADIRAGRRAGVNWGALQSMRAIRDGRYVSLGYDEWRATLETPVALLKMAKALYPTAFADVDVDAAELAHYREVYGMDDTQARKAVEAQHFAGSVVVS